MLEGPTNVNDLVIFALESLQTVNIVIMHFATFGRLATSTAILFGHFIFFDRVSVVTLSYVCFAFGQPTNQPA